MKINKKPIALSHIVNSECNLRCGFCKNWKENKEVLSKEEVFDLIDEAKDFGILLYNIWGTEPLLREDLGEIIDYASEVDLLISMVTNGVLLEDKLCELRNLDYLTVSLDGFDSHEEIRNTEVEKIIDAIELADKEDMYVGINTVINKKNLEEIPKLIDFCTQKEIPISFEPIYEYEDINNSEYTLEDDEEYRKTIDIIKKKKKKNSPIINSLTYLEQIKDINNLVNCKNKISIMHIDSEGQLKVCRAKNQQLGSYKQSLSELWNKTKQDREKITRNCNGCQFFGYLESRYINQLKLEPIKNVIGFI
ncbi:pyrroloquinoline quinone biosynthesis protein PqqE [archaeon SCG-AAA382B04]|nr:pyrroloquinoline quinone biosynthesis protein PqqE [archaeon SCG-AAA382B04]